MRILISEDEEILLTAIEFRLQKQGFEVFVTKDGEAAISVFNAEDPDIVILDLDMPKKNGMQVMQHIRKVKKSSCPIVIITAFDDDDIVMEACEAGADDFIMKPFKPKELILRVKRLARKIKPAMA